MNNIILLLVIIVVFMVLIAMLLIALNDILIKLKKIEEKLQKDNKTTVRKHTNIKNTNHNSILASRGDLNGYEVYKNKNGLYEPIRPHGGIKIEEKEG